MTPFTTGHKRGLYKVESNLRTRNDPRKAGGPAGASAPLDRAHCKPQRGRAPQRRAPFVRPLRATRRQHRCSGGIREGKSTHPCAKMATGCEVLLLLVATTTTTIPTKPIHIPASASTSTASLPEALPRPVSVTSIHSPWPNPPKQRKG